MQGNYFAALPVRTPGAFLEALRGSAPPGLRWFHPDDLHLTLAFFGKEDPHRIPALLEIMARIAFDERAVTLGPLRALPRPRRFSALSFEVAAGAAEIENCIKTWRGPLLETARCPPDPRTPLPHLTVARPDRKHPACRPRAILDWLQSLEPPSDQVHVLPPALYGWSPERPRRQFRIIRAC